MQIFYRKKFLKDLALIPTKHRQKIERFVFEQFPNSETFFSTRKLERLKGYPGYYKIRFGDYRVGLKIVGDKVVFERVLHRREIYRFYP